MRSKSTVGSVPADSSSAGFPPPCRPSDSPSKQQRRVARCQHRDVCILLDADRQPSIQAAPASLCRGSAQRLPTRDAKFRRRCRALQDTQEVHDLCRSHHSLMIFFFGFVSRNSSLVLFSLMTCYIRGTSVQLQQLKYQTFFLRLLSLRFTSVGALSRFRRENSSLCVTALAQVTFLQTCDYFRPVFFFAPSRPAPSAWVSCRKRSHLRRLAILIWPPLESCSFTSCAFILSLPARG